jgi:metal-responsive CopG/Arc/MetJ family transcriptional regulator
LTEFWQLFIMKIMEKDRVTLKIPRPLYVKLQTVIEGSGFRSVNEFVVYVLRDLVALKRGESEKDLSKDEIDAIKQRLKNLGYF